MTNFTTTEIKILKELLLDGVSNKTIGDRIGISERYVKHCMTSIMSKMEVKNRVQVVLKLMRGQ